MSVDPTRADVRIGMFVLAALVLLVVGSLWIAGSGWLAPRRVPYVVRMRDSGGVQAGDGVRVAGVAVGKIRQVELRPGEEWPVRIRVSVRHAVPIHADGSARIATSGLMGTPFLQIEPGSPESPLLEPGGELFGEATAGFDAVLGRLTEMGDEVLGLLDQASRLLDRLSGGLEEALAGARDVLGEENRSNLRNALAGLNGTLENAGPRLSSLLERLESMADSANQGLDGLPQLESKLEALLDGLTAAIGDDGSRLAGLLDTAEGSLGSAGQLLEVVGDNRRELEAALRDLRDTVANLKAFSQTVKERPYSLVRIRHEPQRRPGDDVP